MRRKVANEPRIRLNDNSFQTVANITNGRFTPIEGFLGQNDFYEAINDGSLEDRIVWPLPIILNVPSEKPDVLMPSQTVGLNYGDCGIIGTLDIEISLISIRRRLSEPSSGRQTGPTRALTPSLRSTTIWWEGR